MILNRKLAIPTRRRFKIMYAWSNRKGKSFKEKASQGFKREWFSKMYKYELNKPEKDES